MAISPAIITTSSPFLSTGNLTVHHQNLCLLHSKRTSSSQTQMINRASFKVQAAKPPAGVVWPKVEPKFKAPFLGFTRTAETWNSRACMIGLIGTFIVELILNKGILQLIGIEIGKGLDIPL